MNQQVKPVVKKPGVPEEIYNLFHSSETGMMLSGNDENSSFGWLAGFGVKEQITTQENEPVFEKLKTFFPQEEIVFGHLSYDLKNSIEDLSSAHRSGMDFPAACFFVPEKIFRAGEKIVLPGDLSEKIISPKNNSKITLRQGTPKEKYIGKVRSLLEHIHRGDIYEINYCIDFFAEEVVIDPVAAFKKLDILCEAPFSALYKNGDQWLICASPERFLEKKGTRIVSQPIKGTRPRGKTAEEDANLKEELLHDEKERSENVMIVDLVRNDLSKSAKKGSVKVDELFGIYSFKTVHQMVSTVSAELAENIHPVDAIRNAFPMGSMTGAPKIRAMQLAEEYEDMKRGLYSGAVGYFTPEMDFDFNVVIRSIQYNAKTGYLSMMVGSAITANSDPEKEYAECLVKARALFEALGLELKA